MIFIAFFMPVFIYYIQIAFSDILPPFILMMKFPAVSC